jgi:hypothetical protein
MNYEELLIKYIKHVVDCEGTDFIHRLNGGQGEEVVFTDSEVRTLQRLVSPHAGKGCNKILAAEQWFRFCGETDMGQSAPALCTECGGEYKLAE